MRGFLRIGKVTGIPVSVHWTLAVIAWFLGVGLATGALPASVPNASTTAYWATAGVGVVAFFLSILLHELAHALVARRYGVQTDGIELWLLGGMARLNRDAPSPKADGLIAVAGPLASILVGAAFIGAAIGLDAVGVWPLVPAMIAWLGIVNIIIAVFNLLPGAPLDGGRILRAVRWAQHHDRARATREAAQAGQFVGWAVVILGVWMIFRGWGGIFIPLTGGFLIINAKAEQMAVGGRGAARRHHGRRRHVVRRGRGDGRHRRRDHARPAGPAGCAPRRRRAGRPGPADRPGGRGPAVDGARAAATVHRAGPADGAVQPDRQGRAARGAGARAAAGHAVHAPTSPSGATAASWAS